MKKPEPIDFIMKIYNGKKIFDGSLSNFTRLSNEKWLILLIHNYQNLKEKIDTMHLTSHSKHCTA